MTAHVTDAEKSATDAVAAAIHCPAPSRPCYADDRCTCLRATRAVLRAMLIPTAEMLKAAEPHMDSWSSNLAWWDKMIASAISGEAQK